ncbi:hypothetical protein ACQKWADRAFT_269295 [Trichoderma austrokoningii]
MKKFPLQQKKRLPSVARVLIGRISGMPRKFITQDVKDQNRESQRRSRARRTEVMNDLKKQVEAFQQQGAAASLEMQRVAQAVAYENQRLRSLLKIHGVSQNDIERHIEMSPSSTQTSSYEPSSLRCRSCGSTSIVAEKLPVLLPADQICAGSSISQDASHSRPSSVVRSQAVQNPHAGEKMAIEGAPTSVALLPRSKGDQKEPHEQQSRSRISYTRMDKDKICNASILVDLQHHADTERVRAALGCKGPNSCTVNNIKIFQLLENFS